MQAIDPRSQSAANRATRWFPFPPQQHMLSGSLCLQATNTPLPLVSLQAEAARASTHDWLDAVRQHAMPAVLSQLALGPSPPSQANTGLRVSFSVPVSLRKTLGLCRLGRRLRQHELQRDTPAEVDVPRRHDDAHPPSAEDPLDSLLAAEQVARLDAAGGHPLATVPCHDPTICRAKTFEPSRTVMKAVVVGGGLAGCEAAFQLAERGIAVELIEQKPKARTAAQTTDFLCELVCSNSMRGAALVNAVGLLKEELRRAGSLIMDAAHFARVPAGGALAVDRDVFAETVTRRIVSHPLISVRHEIVQAIPPASATEPVILATGPLTGDSLTADLAEVVGASHLAYYDAIAPIVSADSIDWTVVFKQSRWGKGRVDDRDGAESPRDPTAGGDEAYVNCPFDKDAYFEFVRAIVAAEKVEPRSFEDARYFEGCLPIEVMASRGERTLAFGPMKPVGLTDPKTGRRPYAVVQLRPEDQAMTAYNLVGFQTRMTYGEQARVLKMIPGLEGAEILRFGSVHRNTFIDSPRMLDERMQLKARPNVFLAGQITGVEGYVESCAGGFVCAILLAQSLRGEPITPPPDTTALGGIRTHLSRVTDRFQPSNITWACIPPPEDGRLRKRDRYQAMADRALADLDRWLLRSYSGAQSR
jgi:methylenetetrahydrofolate--tRNA-(uracil-5-)-methyltransferase